MQNYKPLLLIALLTGCSSMSHKNVKDASIDYEQEEDVSTGSIAEPSPAPAEAEEVAVMEMKPQLTKSKKKASVSYRAMPKKEIHLDYAPPPPQNTEEYTDHGVNPFTTTTEDALSTFSIDVDTASYTIARKKLKQNQLPKTASVRVEEFVNYFDYNYDSQKANPFVVHMDGMEDPFRKGHHVLRVGLQGKELSAKERPSLRLTFLVDISGSMSSPDKLPLAQKSMHMLVDSLRDDDSVSLVTYAGAVRKVLSPTYGDDKQKIHEAIDQLMAGGSTAMSSGLDLAYEQAWQSFKEGAENRVVILSDGDANVGNTSWQEMLQQIKAYADRGVTVSTIGLGMGNYKDTRMEQLANKGDGNNYYVDSKEEAQKIFVDGFNGTMITIARDVKIQMEFNPSVVESYRLIGYENRDIADKDFRNDRVDAGEVGAGHSVTALYELKLAPNSKIENAATARIRYEAPGADKAATERAFEFSTRAFTSPPSQELKLAYTAATFAEILRHSPNAAGISLDKLIRYGKGATRSGQKYDSELLSLMKTARSLKTGRQIGSN